MAQVGERASDPGNRYLLVIETSRAMQARADGVSKVIKDLLSSGIRGQLRKGDTVGLWTYNENLYTGRFPLQYWATENQREISEQVLKFLAAQKFEQSSRLAPVLFAIQVLVERSESLTVILVSSGTENVVGTPFDDRINDYYRLWQAQQQKARMPFVTVLRAIQGKIVDYAVTSAPWPVEMPVTPPPAPPGPAVAQKPAAAPTPKKPPTAPPLILSGKKSDPVKTPQPEPTPSAREAELPKPELPKAASAATNSVEAPPQVAVSPKPPEVTVPTAAKLEAPPDPKPIPEPEPVSAKPQRVPDPVPSSPPPVPGAEPTPAGTPVTAPEHSAPSRAPKELGNPSLVASAPAPPETKVAESAVPPSAPTNQVAVAESNNSLGRTGLLVTALVVGLAVFFVAWFLNRAPRISPTGSLISRSARRRKK